MRMNPVGYAAVFAFLAALGGSACWSAAAPPTSRAAGGVGSGATAALAKLALDPKSPVRPEIIQALGRSGPGAAEPLEKLARDSAPFAKLALNAARAQSVQGLARMWHDCKSPYEISQVSRGA